MHPPFELIEQALSLKGCLIILSAFHSHRFAFSAGHPVQQKYVFGKPGGVLGSACQTGFRFLYHGGAFAIEGSTYEDCKAFLRGKGVEIFDEEARTTGVFPGRQFYIRDPDTNVIEFSEWAGKEF